MIPATRNRKAGPWSNRQDPIFLIGDGVFILGREESGNQKQLERWRKEVYLYLTACLLYKSIDPSRVVLIKVVEMDGITIRVVESDDVGAILTLEKESFSREHYPLFFFVQAREIFSNTFLLAEDETRQPIGYILGAPIAQDPSQSWILSMSVTPTKRRNGVGSALLQAAQEALRSAGATKLFLSVAVDNSEAISLYRKFGYNEERTERMYFGKNQPRIIMSKFLYGLNSITQPCLNSANLLSESSTGVSFSSVLLALSAAVLPYLCLGLT